MLERILLLTVVLFEILYVMGDGGLNVPTVEVVPADPKGFGS